MGSLLPGWDERAPGVAPRGERSAGLLADRQGMLTVRST
jgi:hypothetical protein